MAPQPFGLDVILNDLPSVFSVHTRYLSATGENRDGVEVGLLEKRECDAGLCHQPLVLVDLALGRCQSAATLEEPASASETPRFSAPHQLKLEGRWNDRSFDCLCRAYFGKRREDREMNRTWSNEMLIASLQDHGTSVWSELES